MGDVVQFGDGLGVAGRERGAKTTAGTNAAAVARAGNDDVKVAAHGADRLRDGVLRALADGHHQYH